MKKFQIYSIAILCSTFCLCPISKADIIENIEDLEPKKKAKKAPPKKPTPLPKTNPRPEDGPASTTDTKSNEPTSNSSEAKADSKAPIKLKGDGQSTYSRKKGIMTLKDNVVITQGNLRLQSDEAVVTFYKIKSKDDGDEVKKVEITGHVKVSKYDPDPAERMTAHGDRAIFLNKTQKVRLIGNARLYRGGDLMKGRQITYDIQTGMVLVDQAQGVVQPKESK